MEDERCVNLAEVDLEPLRTRQGELGIADHFCAYLNSNGKKRIDDTVEKQSTERPTKIARRKPKRKQGSFKPTKKKSMTEPGSSRRTDFSKRRSIGPLFRTERPQRTRRLNAAEQPEDEEFTEYEEEQLKVINEILVELGLDPVGPDDPLPDVDDIFRKFDTQEEELQELKGLVDGLFELNLCLEVEDGKDYRLEVDPNLDPLEKLRVAVKEEIPRLMSLKETPNMLEHNPSLEVEDAQFGPC